MRARLIAVFALGALGLGACSAGSHQAATTSTVPPVATTTTANSTSTTSASTTTSVPTTQDLVVTAAIRAQLVAAGAGLNSLVSSDYTGLRPGETYYAFDAATQTYWSGAALSPSPSSMPAQVAAQDDGAYLLFERPQGGAWKVYDVGLAGTSDGSACPVTVPAGVLSLWGWPPGGCRPSTIS